MATMYVGGGLYLPTTGTASKPKTTSTPTGGTVTVAQRNAIASKTKPAATTAVKKPTTNTLSSMAGSSLGTTSTKKPTTTTAAKKPTTNTLSSMAGTSLGTTSSRSTNPLSTMAGRTLGINAALPQPPRLTKAQIGNRFTQSLAAGAKTGAAVPNPAGLTRDEADTFRSRFYTDFYSGKPVQRVVDSPVFQPGMMGRGQPVPSYDYLFGARNDDSPYVSAYDVARYGSVNSRPGLLPSKEFGGYPGARPEAKLASTLLAGGAGALDAVVSPAYGLGTGLLDYLSGGTPDDFMNSYAGGYGDANAIFQPFETLDPSVYGKGANAGIVAATAYGMPGVMGPTRAAAEAAAAAARASAAARAGAGIDAVIPPTVRLPAAATPVPPSIARLPPDDLDALLYRTVEEGLDAPVPPVAATARPALSPREEYVRDFVETWGELPPANDDYFGPASARTLYDPSTLSDPLSQGSLARLESLSTPLEGIYPYPRGRTSSQYDDMLKASVKDALGVGPTIARAEQLTPPATTSGVAPSTGRNAFSDILDAYDAEQLARAAKPGELFPDINPAATISDPMDVFGPQRPAGAISDPGSFLKDILRRDGSDPGNVVGYQGAGSPFINSYPDPMDVFGPQRPDFMFPGEAADVIRPGPRVAADTKRMDPITKRMLLAAGGAGVAIPGLAGLSLLANGQLTPAPPATTPPAPEPGGIDVAASGAPRLAQALRQAQINQSAANLDPAIASQDQFNKWLADKALAAAPVKTIAVDAEGAPVGVVGETAEDLGAYLNVNSPGQVELVGAEDVQPVDRPAITTSTDKARFDELFETSGTGDTPLVAGEEPVSATGGTGTPVAGEKFTPGPGQFVGTNGYIYEQSSDGSFEKVGKVPGYTPAQLSEAANKGAFRDPNNIVVGSGKRTKKDSTESLGVTNSGSKKRKKKDEDETDESTGGTDGTGTGTYTPPTQAMLDALYAPYMRQYTGPGAGYAPGVSPEWNYFTPAFADGGLVDGRLVLGDGGPKEDKIPAMIDGVEQAKLSNGEFVMTAAAVKNAGGGDIELGAKRLMDLNNMLSYGQPAERLKVQHVK